MDSNPQTTTVQASNDLSPEWLALIGRIRSHALRALDDSHDNARELAREALQLCQHVERLHRDVESLLGNLTTTAFLAQGDSSPSDAPRPTEEDKVAMEIRREIHQDQVTVRDVIKALFLWQDSPADRLDHSGRD
jgi:hypothetical protein